jgi:hypothetical protein
MKMDLEIGCEDVDSTGIGKGPVAYSCKHCNEPYVPFSMGHFLTS